MKLKNTSDESINLENSFEKSYNGKNSTLSFEESSSSLSSVNATYSLQYDSVCIIYGQKKSVTLLNYVLCLIPCEQANF